MKKTKFTFALFLNSNQWKALVASGDSTRLSAQVLIFWILRYMLLKIHVSVFPSINLVFHKDSHTRKFYQKLNATNTILPLPSDVKLILLTIQQKNILSMHSSFSTLTEAAERLLPSSFLVTHNVSELFYKKKSIF